MKFQYLLFLGLSCQSFALDLPRFVEVIKRQTTSINWASLQSQASELTAKYSVNSTYTLPFITPGGNLLQPPASLVPVIITAVPASIIAELAVPSQRSSIASEFRAGNTPSWYLTLPSAVKSYIESLQTQIAAGNVDLSATPSNIPFAAATAVAGADTGTGTGTADATAKVTTKTSKAGAAQATGGIGLSVGAALGLMGVAIAL